MGHNGFIKVFVVHEVRDTYLFTACLDFLGGISTAPVYCAMEKLKALFILLCTVQLGCV